MAKSYKQKAIDDLKAIVPEFAKLTEDFLLGDIWNRPGLSQQDKSLITVICLVALNTTVPIVLVQELKPLTAYTTWNKMGTKESLMFDRISKNPLKSTMREWRNWQTRWT